MYAIVILGILSSCMSSYKRHIFTSYEVKNKFKWDDEEFLNTKINLSDSGIYVALINDSLHFTDKIAFGKLHDFYINGDGPMIKDNNGIFQINHDTINVEYFDFIAKRWNQINYIIKNRNEIIMMPDSFYPESKKYIFYDFNQPVRFEYTPLFNEQVLWQTQADYIRWLNTPKSFSATKP